MNKEVLLSVQHLSKSYDGLQTLENINLTIHRGEIYGILGRNGAGKSTLLECMVGLRKPDSGDVYIFHHGGEMMNEETMREKIGIQPQTLALFEQQTIRETFELFGSFYQESVPVDKLLHKLTLSEIQGKAIKKLSGGQKQRVIIGIALIGKPDIILLDEPTTGLDVQVRQLIWALIKELKNEGKTILITSHYMDEVESLCDVISILHERKIAATGTPKSIAMTYTGSSLGTLDEAFVKLTGRDLRVGVD